MKTHHQLSYILAALLPFFSASAKTDAPLKPIIATPGKVLCEETFTSVTLTKPWKIAKGDWQIKEGALCGLNKEADHHAAVLSLGIPNHDSIIQFSFRLDEGKGFGLSYNSAKGHLFRVLVDKEGVKINMDGSKTDPTLKGSTLGSIKDKIKPGEWHTMLVEVIGTKVAVQIDSGLKLEASNPEIDVDKKGYNFVNGGISLDNVKACQAEPLKP